MRPLSREKDLDTNQKTKRDRHNKTIVKTEIGSSKNSGVPGM